jgi:RimJ/RimL family protein N-acetyltransferase
MHKLSRSEFQRVRPLFRGLDYQLIITAVLDHTSPGEIYVDDGQVPASALMISPEGNFLVGDAHDASFNAWLKQMLMEKMAPEGAIEIQYEHTHWADCVAALFQIDLPLIFNASYFTFDELRFFWRDLLPPEYSLQMVDRDFLQRRELQNFENVIAKIDANWGSRESFLAVGVGCCLLHQDVIVSECLADCAGGKRCEIGISTEPRYRRRGLAALCVAATVERCLAHGLTEIGWHCANNNLGSVKTAQKVGFRKQFDYPIFEVIPDRFRNLCANGAYHVFLERWPEAAAFFEDAFRLQDAPPRPAYLAAAAHAMGGNHERARIYLEKALAGGAATLSQIEADARFTSFRATPLWAQLRAARQE